MNDGRAIANFVLDLCDAQGKQLTQLSLQKLLFFCHAWSLAKLKRPLIKHQFEAWKFGPVLQYLYQDFREFERSPITTRARKLDPRTGEKMPVRYELDEPTTILLTKVVAFYGRLRPGTLVEFSHVEGGPWQQVWDHSGQVNPGMVITDEAIYDYYSKATAPF